VGVVGFGLAAMFLIAVPFLDRRSSRGERSPLFTALAIAGLLYLVVLTIVGHYAA
jgi:quinol-cytochrome oxidoreductase complex cytochrome b subunit